MDRPGGLCGLRGEDFRRGKPRPHTAGQSKVWNYMSGAWSRKDWQGPGRGLGTPCPCKQGAADRSAHSAGPTANLAVEQLPGDDADELGAISKEPDVIDGVSGMGSLGRDLWGVMASCWHPGWALKRSPRQYFCIILAPFDTTLGALWQCAPWWASRGRSVFRVLNGCHFATIGSDLVSFGGRFGRPGWSFGDFWGSLEPGPPYRYPGRPAWGTQVPQGTKIGFPNGAKMVTKSIQKRIRN